MKLGILVAGAALVVAPAGFPADGGGGPAGAADGAISRASAWLIARQGKDGAFEPARPGGPSRVALTAMALWALAESRSIGDDAEAGKAAAFLLRFRQPSGGIFEPRAGLAVYTSAVANRALETWAVRQPSPDLKAAIDAANLFVYRAGAPESFTDQAARPPAPEVALEADRILTRTGELPDSLRRSLEFLRSAQAPDRVDRPRRLFEAGAAVRPGDDRLTYDDLLRSIYELDRRDNPSVYKIRSALERSYTLEKNPDLANRYGPGGFPRQKSGLFYYYLTMARSLAAVGGRRLVTADGASHDWVRDLGDRLLSLQGPEGSWVNEDGRWWEDDPVLVTSYAILALDICRKMDRAGPGEEGKR